MTIRQIYIFLAALLVVIMSLATACGGGDNTPSPAEAPDLATIPLTDVLGNGKPTLAEFGRGGLYSL